MNKKTAFRNQLKWDLRFVRWAFLILVIVAPLQVWLELREFQDFELGLDLGLVLSGWLWILMMMVSVVALILVVQKDVPTGGREFWLSRPVARGAMFFSKLSILALFLLVLATVWVAAPFLSGDGAHGALFVLSFANQSAWILGLAFVLAAISPSLPQLLRNGLMVGGLFFLVAFFWMNLRETGTSERHYDVRVSASLVARIVFLMGGVGLVAGLYSAKSIRQGLSLLMVLFLVCVGIVLFWPVNVVSEKISEAEKREEGWEQVSVGLELREDDIARYRRDSSYGAINGVRERQIRCSGLLANLPEGYSVRDFVFSGDFEVDGASIWSSSQGLSRLPTYLPDGALAGFENLKSVPVGRDFGNFEGEHRLRLPQLKLASVPEDELKKWHGMSISYRGEARVEAVKTVRIARFQFGKDVLLDTHGMRMKVAFEGGGESPASFRIEGQAWYPRPFFTAVDYQGMRSFLVNEKEKTFFEVSSDGSGSGSRGKITYWDKEFDLTRWSWEEVFKELPNREEWLGESFVYLYGQISQGEFVVPVELEGFRLEDVTGSFE